MDQDDRVALAEGVVHTSLEATFVLRQPDVLCDALAGIEVAWDADDVRDRRLRRRDDESRHEQEKCYECRKYAYAPSIHRSHSLSERVSLMASINAAYILICNVKCVKVVLRFKRKYNVDMIKQKNRLGRISHISNYFWLLSAIGAGALFWWINSFASLLFVVWVLIAISTFAVIRGKGSSFSALAALYMFAFVACYLLLGIKLMPLGIGMSSEANPMSIVGPMSALNILLIFALVAYFCHKKETLTKKSQRASFSARFFIMAVWLLLGSVVVFNLYAALALQASSPIMLLITLIVVVTGIIGMKRASWSWSGISTILLLASISFYVWNPQDEQSVSVISVLCTFIIILLTYMLGRTFMLNSSRK